MLDCRVIGRYVTWHVCVYHRVTGTAYTILKRKQTERWTKRRNTQLGNKELLSTTAREEERKRRRRGRKGGEEEKEERREEGEEEKERKKRRRKKEVGRVRDRRKRQGMREAQSREEKFEGWRMHIYILHT